MQRFRFFTGWGLLATLLLVGVVAAGAQEGEQDRPLQLKAEPVIQVQPTVPPPPLVAGGPVPDLEVLYTSEVRGYYQPCG